MKAAASLLFLVSLVSACSFVGGSSESSYTRDDCTPRDRGGHSVARVWNEALLQAIERDTPAPTVHARNLFHVSAAMWDAWAAYDPIALGTRFGTEVTPFDLARVDSHGHCSG